jgi:hypothetical protein
MVLRWLPSEEAIRMTHFEDEEPRGVGRGGGVSFEKRDVEIVAKPQTKRSRSRSRTSRRQRRWRNRTLTELPFRTGGTLHSERTRAGVVGTTVNASTRRHRWAFSVRALDELSQIKH